MEKEKTYRRVRFSADVIREAATTLKKQTAATEKGQPNSSILKVEVDGATWNHDSEDEFFADYRRTTNGQYFARWDKHCLSVNQAPKYVSVRVEGPIRSEIESVFEVFEKALEASRIPEPPDPPAAPSPIPTVFIGHGHNGLWRDLKDHLHEKHGYPVEAYEIGARAGHAIRDVLESMLDKSSFALLVMTGEDETAEGKVRARQNVVHEAGLFQGRLGFSRAIVLLEEGLEEFSNLQGIVYIRFKSGRIQETYGEVLATLRREFSA